MHYKGRWPFDCVVIDESSSFKQPSSKRFKALRKILKLTEHMVLLTGTPASNGLIDIWSQCFLIDSGASLGTSKTRFLDRWFRQDYMGYNYIPQSQAAIEEIYAAVEPYTLTITPDELSSVGMVERVDICTQVALPPQALRDYKVMEKHMVLDIKGSDITALNAASLVTKLLQMANGAVYDEGRVVHHVHDAKLNALAEVLEECGGENVLVIYNYIHDRERLMQRFPQARALLGNKPKCTLVEEWNQGTVPMMLLHPRSGGHGLNLQFGGSLIVWFGVTWDLELYQQVNARLHRSGQANIVRVIHLVGENTIENKVLTVLNAKDVVQSNLMEALKKLL
jgi:SNF2 family DNA or RNA helicase